MKIALPARDIFGWSLTTSVVFHLFIVLGISFVLPDPSASSPFSPPLQITLVSTFSDEAPEEADVLAQAVGLGQHSDTPCQPGPASRRQ